MNASCLILAAGQASRMGRPKQMLPFGEGTLLQHVIKIAQQLTWQEIRVVVGAHRDLIAPSLKGWGVEVSVNPNWESGMGSSIAKGVSDLLYEPEGVLILLGDQPFVTHKHLGALIQKYQSSQKAIIASSYQHKMGVPAFFHQSFFPKLKSLASKEGAGKLIKQHRQDVDVVSFAKAAIDLDTPEDYEKWKGF